MTPAQEIENRFTYHKPFGTQPTRYEAIRVAAKLLAAQIQVMCPDSREKSLAHTKLQEVVMFANASIAINEEEPVSTIVDQIGTITGDGDVVPASKL